MTPVLRVFGSEDRRMPQVTWIGSTRESIRSHGPQHSCDTGDKEVRPRWVWGLVMVNISWAESLRPFLPAPNLTLMSFWLIIIFFLCFFFPPVIFIIPWFSRKWVPITQDLCCSFSWKLISLEQVLVKKAKKKKKKSKENIEILKPGFSVPLYSDFFPRISVKILDTDFFPRISVRNIFPEHWCECLVHTDPNESNIPWSFNELTRLPFGVSVSSQAPRTYLCSWSTSSG